MDSTERVVAAEAETGTTASIVAVLDYVCPYSRMAESLLARLREEADVDVDYRAFELRPAPAPLVDADDLELRRVWRETVGPLAETLGIAMRRPPVRARSRKAHEAAAYAREQGRFRAMHEALYHAYFVESRDIGRVDVLLDIGESVGLERTELRVALDIDKYADRVAAEQEAVLAAGIDAVPALVVGDETLIGLPAYDDLRDRALERT